MSYILQTKKKRYVTRSGNIFFWSVGYAFK